MKEAGRLISSSVCNEAQRYVNLCTDFEFDFGRMVRQFGRNVSFAKDRYRDIAIARNDLSIRAHEAGSIIQQGFAAPMSGNYEWWVPISAFAEFVKLSPEEKYNAELRFIFPSDVNIGHRPDGMMNIGMTDEEKEFAASKIRKGKSKSERVLVKRENEAEEKKLEN
jgi:hypothetical protein